jgi:FAS-associated factor 2
VPASAPTSAQTLIEHLQGQVLPRVTPFLERIRSAQRERDRDRHLREEQDRAFQDSARRDKERIEAKMTAEKAEKEARRRADEQAQMEDQRRAREAEATLKRETVRMDWRRWARRALVAPDVIGCQDTVRIAIRLPTDKRVIRHLSPTSTLTTLYAYVDSLLIPPHFAREDDPAISPEGNASGEAGMEQQILLSHNAAEEWWGFKLVLAYPRREIVWKAGTQLGDVESLKGGGQVAVEMLGRRRISSSHASAVDEDGYSTEDSDQ